MQGRHHAPAAWPPQGCEMNATFGTPLQNRLVCSIPLHVHWQMATSGPGKQVSRRGLIVTVLHFCLSCQKWPRVLKPLHPSLVQRYTRRPSLPLSHLWSCLYLVADFSANISRLMWSYLLQTCITWAIESHGDTSSETQEQCIALSMAITSSW